ncbi:MAG: PH domain-containing protein [Alphaproteobacteria bacterium]|nr:PH domain-containing protein [Alphaproteobacteria bacterium]
MLYVQQSLGPDEELVHIGKFHWMYTVNAFFSIIWGMVFSIFIIAGAVIVYQNLGKLPPGTDWLQAVRELHPFLRIGAFVMFLLGVWGFAVKMVTKATTEIAITSNRLVYKRGLIARQVGEISIDRIEGVNVLQSISGRLFNYGRLAIRGMGVGEVVLPPIEDPIKFRQAIERARSL